MRLRLPQGRTAVGQFQPGAWRNEGLENIGPIYPPGMDALLLSMSFSFYLGTNISFLIANPVFNLILRRTKC